jgi:Mrp family chromosome partitioning ATPase
MHVQNASPSTRTEVATSGAYESLLYNVFPPARPEEARSVVVAFTAPSAGAGVTHVVTALADAMHQRSPGMGAQYDMAWVKRQTARSGDDQEGEPAWSSGWNQRKALIEELRLRGPYVALDCPSLASSTDALSLAPLVDGIVLIVEADSTTKAQIRSAERQLEAAGGTILGMVLNKRRYPIPNFIFKNL